MRRVLAGASLVLAAAFLTGCGGDDDSSDAPDDASIEDFCEAFESGPQGDPSEDDLKEWADELNDAGTPEDMDDDARDGFELFVEKLQDVDPDDFGSDAELEDVFGDADDAEKVGALIAYYGQECIDVGEVPTE